MKKIQPILISLALSFSLTSCSTTEKLVYIESAKYDFQLIDKVVPINIRVHNEDKERLQLFVKAIRRKIRFYEEQIKTYLKE